MLGPQHHSDSVRGLATAGGHHTTAGAADAAPAGFSVDDSARALALLGEGLTRSQIAHRMGVRLDLLGRLLRAAGVDPDALPRSPVSEILRLHSEGRRDPDIAKRLGMHSLEVWRVRRQHRVPAVVGPLKPDDTAAKRRAGNRAIQATPKVSDGVSWDERSRGERERFISALLAGGERFTDDPRADRIGRPVVIIPRSGAHSGASSAMAWF